MAPKPKSRSGARGEGALSAYAGLKLDFERVKRQRIRAEDECDRLEQELEKEVWRRKAAEAELLALQANVGIVIT